MIIFHEGMPRSGKSYAAMKDHIIPALQAGRMVFARLDGLDFDRIAEVAGLEKSTVERLLHHIEESQVKDIWKLDIPKDALICIDELQNYWPQGRAALPPEITKWIAEHGHHGWDILPMGQLLTDCHRTWVNRTNRKLQFIKKDMLGKPDQYKWIMYTGKPDSNGKVKFVEVSKGDASYDPKYFGTYASHSEGTENTENYADDRVNIWKSPMFRKWLPLLGVFTLLAGGYLVYLFKGGLVVQKEAPKPVASVTEVKENGQTTQVIREGAAIKPEATKAAYQESEKEKRRGQDFDLPDVVTDLGKENRIRLGAVVRSAAGVRVLVEWRDSSMRLVEQMNKDQLGILGWYVMVSDDNRMAILVRPGYRLVVTSWPIEEQIAKSTEKQTEQIRKESASFGVPAKPTT